MSRIAVIADFLEEKWPSMDLVAEELAQHLTQVASVEGILVRQPLRARIGGRPPSGPERAVGRFVQLPLELAMKRVEAEYFHIADHSYAHLALLFPRDRVGVYCHDIDAFRALLPGSGASRPRVLLSRLLLRGLRHARVVFHSTHVVREEILQHGLVPAARLVHAPYGVAREFLEAPRTEPATEQYLLHVGSCIPRKNVDFLLRVFADAHQNAPDLKLVQVGGQWTDSQLAYIQEQHLGSCIDQRRGISRAELAKIYSGARAVLMPSLSEGFGLPIIEALACGVPVVASDIPVFREVGFQGVRFCSTSATEPWARALRELLATSERVSQETYENIQKRYAWLAHARTISGAYLGGPSASEPAT